MAIEIFRNPDYAIAIPEAELRLKSTFLNALKFLLF